LKDGLGALDGFVTIYLREGADIAEAISRLAAACPGSAYPCCSTAGRQAPIPAAGRATSKSSTSR
jgi:hypothetical protein